MEEIVNECIAASEQYAPHVALRLMDAYRNLPQASQRTAINMIARQHGIDRAQLLKAARSPLDSLSSEMKLRDALDPPVVLLFERIASAEGGFAFLVDLRAQLLAWIDAGSAEQGDDALAAITRLDIHLRGLLRVLCISSLLPFRRLSWESTPMATAARLVDYDRVHPMTSLADVRFRLQGRDRRCYALNHVTLPLDPLCVVYVCLRDAQPTRVDGIMAREAPQTDPHAATHAVFYSISSTKEGLRGVPLGHSLLRKAVGALVEELPQLRHFVTMSPIPGFIAWLRSTRGRNACESLLTTEGMRPLLEASGQRDVVDAIMVLLKAFDVHQEQLRGPLLRLCAHYLSGVYGVDAVAKFHLSNGATLQAIHWAANTSARGCGESACMMATYAYVPDVRVLEDNRALFMKHKKVIASDAVRALLDMPASRL